MRSRPDHSFIWFEQNEKAFNALSPEDAVMGRLNIHQALPRDFYFAEAIVLLANIRN